MVELLQSYRGWTQKEVADALGRNVHAVVPESGNPKLDLVEKLSSVLDWPIEMIAADLREAGRDAEREAAAISSDLDSSASDPSTIVDEVWRLVDGECWEAVIERTSPSRIDRLDREIRGRLLMYRQAALESNGQYLAAIEACREGLDCVARGTETSYRLRGALAYLLLVTDHPYDAEALAASLVSELRDEPAESPLRLHLGMSLLVRGLALRSQGALPGPRRLQLLNEARDSLNAASMMLTALSENAGPPRVRSPGRTADVAAMEVSVLLGEMGAQEFVDSVVALLDDSPDVTTLDSIAAESLGWCCVFASRTIVAEPERIDSPDRALAILTNKVDEIAERLGHWALRERLFTIEHLHRVQSLRDRGESPPWNLDDQDVRVLMGTMGRFPKFRRVGWRILREVRRERREESESRP
ncbi:MAG TPA: hypothetical protein PKC43_01970 [Phycisphaerales bacterium]|nr:hypothetical protein [Phycisphaerales bacterium]HMP36192.1 hypothetical protein [Phycisphaerales bacterium]